MNIQEIISKMSLEDKIKLCSGASFWETEKMEQYGIPSFFMSDGPSGLRTQKNEADHLGINKSEESTCFPAACTSSATWNTQLLEEMGKAIGEEALHYEVDVVLGPGVNIKRNPLCGRNFEYFSEDPYLAGKLGESWINGVQSKGVGTSLKHFAANNQEQDRMSGSSLVDERAMREIYLPAFENAVREAQPATVMCSYNQVNGTFASDSKTLLTDILRKEWGFQGLVVTDWGAMNCREEAFKAGCDLEMPYSCNMFDEEVKNAVKNGTLPEAKIDESVERILNLAFKAQNNRKSMNLNKKEHHALARKIATEGAVLLKNKESILPLKKTVKIALCGALAENVRYQGAGSSHINPYQLSNIKDSVNNLAKAVTYYPSYELDGKVNMEYKKAAIEGAKRADVAVLVIGLPDSYESEGFDRTNMRIPQSHQELIQEVAKVNENIVVVLLGGSPVEMPWIDSAKAVLNMYLGGQAVGEACADLLFGVANPSGKLAETYPIKYEDCSSSATYGVNPRQVEYAESIYVGYRYYDKAKIAVRFPFGYGLSYTKFEYSDLRINSENVDFTKEEAGLSLSCKIRNAGTVAGAEVVQLYVADKTPNIFKAVKELKGFAKFHLEPGEEKEVSFVLDKRSFAHYDINRKNWEVLKGKYDILIGTSSADIRLNQTIQVIGTVDNVAYEKLPTWYRNPVGKPSVSDFETIYGTKIMPYVPQNKGKFTLMNTFNDMKNNFMVRIVMKAMNQMILKMNGGDKNSAEYIFTIQIVFNTPLIRLVQQGGGATPLSMMAGVVEFANGHFIRGIKTMAGKK